MDGVANPRVRHGFQRVRLQSKIVGKSMTKQAFAAECDINNIMKRFEKDGILNHFNTFRGDYGDFTNCPDYHEAQNKIILADSMFLTLPAKVRDRFQNNPGAFLEFVSDPKNKDEMKSLGLLRDLPPPAPASPAPDPAKA